MEKETVSKIIREGQDFIPEIRLFERPIEFEEKGNYVFVGVRQCGKSYMLYQRIQQLLREGHNIKEIVYVNFDDERLQLIKADELDLILQAYASMNEGRPLMFFDEIQKGRCLFNRQGMTCTFIPKIALFDLCHYSFRDPHRKYCQNRA